MSMAAQILYLDTGGMGVVSFKPRLFTQEKEPIGLVYHKPIHITYMEVAEEHRRCSVNLSTIFSNLTHTNQIVSACCHICVTTKQLNAFR
jgi:hypothetical protein